MIETAVKMFQKCNPIFGRTSMIMSDKDFVERDVYKTIP